MSQTWTDNVYQSDHVYSTDLQNMENNFAALKSMFSGTSAPSSPIAGMPWFDTTQKVQKQRNAGNAAWVGLMHGDVSEKRLVYRSAAMDGYARDSSVTDRVIALQGGSVYTTAGSGQGSWTISGLAKDAHTHSMGSHTHTLASGTLISTTCLYERNVTVGGTFLTVTASSGGSLTRYRLTPTTAGPSEANTGAQSDGGVTHTPAWRPLAAVCLLVYLDL